MGNAHIADYFGRTFIVPPLPKKRYPSTPSEPAVLVWQGEAMFMDDRLEQSRGPIVVCYEEAAMWALDFAKSHQGPDIHSLHAVSYRCAVGSVERLMSVGHAGGLEYGLYADEMFWMNGAGPLPDEPPSSRVIREIVAGGGFD